MPTSQTDVSPSHSDRADFPALGTRYLLRSDHTDGRFALIEHTIPPHTLAAPVHTHADEDEYSYVLSGRIGAMVGDTIIDAGPGDLVAKPRAIPHAFWNAGDEPARLLVLISPGAFGQYFADLAPVLSADGEPDFEALLAIQGRYRLTMDFESIADLCERYGLST
jgi:mannose-6-phosphate isomerase-like protein (cupin superfamily)